MVITGIILVILAMSLSSFVEKQLGVVAGFIGLGGFLLICIGGFIAGFIIRMQLYRHSPRKIRSYITRSLKK
jgi:hypothetical protein